MKPNHAKPDYKKTMYACFIGYIVQAIVNNFVPLLFVTFQNSYQIPLSEITAIITVNFMIQLLVDLLSAGFIDKIGYRASAVCAHIFAASGLLLLTVLPELFSNAFYGILLSVIIYAIGGGLIEVLISPIIEACPTDNKEEAMSLSHSFYCWGHVGVVLISCAFFALFGTGNWKLLAVLWTLVPIANTILFFRAPIYSLNESGESGLSIKELFSKNIFWILMLMMLCSGASEQAVGQWASAFAEKGLEISKAVGDLAGPMTFALMMGIARLIYGKYGAKLHLDKFIVFSCMLCIASYLCISLVPIPLIGLLGCALCGFSVGIFWPGTYSKAAASIKGGGTAMFALLALAGDMGCSGGPTLAGLVAGAFQNNLRIGILSAIIFPILMLLGMLLLKRADRN